MTPEPEAEEKPVEDAGAIAARVVSAARAPNVDETVEVEEDTPDAGTGPLTFDDEFLMADEPEDVLAVDPTARVTSDTPAESVAEKLRRIRAVVSRNIETQAETAANAEDDADEGRRRRQT